MHVFFLGRGHPAPPLGQIKCNACHVSLRCLLSMGLVIRPSDPYRVDLRLLIDLSSFLCLAEGVRTGMWSIAEAQAESTCTFGGSHPQIFDPVVLFHNNVFHAEFADRPTLYSLFLGRRPGER